MDQSDFDIAPCLATGPLADAGQQAVRCARDLGQTHWGMLMRAFSVSYVFDGMERVFATNQDPTGGVARLFSDLAAFMDVGVETGFSQLGISVADDAVGDGLSVDVEQTVGQHYGRLFKDFSSTSYWDEPRRLLGVRLDRNSVDIPNLGEKHVLDAGCGGGRYTTAWRLLGAKQATGIDISDVGIGDAQNRVSKAAIDGVDFKQGNV